MQAPHLKIRACLRLWHTFSLYCIISPSLFYCFRLLSSFRPSPLCFLLFWFLTSKIAEEFSLSKRLRTWQFNLHIRINKTHNDSWEHPARRNVLMASS
jgi:hypothetical protein